MHGNMVTERRKDWDPKKLVVREKLLETGRLVSMQEGVEFSQYLANDAPQ